jgi:hypothetical protein
MEESALDVVVGGPPPVSTTSGARRMVVAAFIAFAGVALIVLTVQRAAAERMRDQVAMTCGVPVSIVGDPHTETVDGHPATVVDVDPTTLHIPATRAFAVVHRQPDYVDCRLSGPP